MLFRSKESNWLIEEFMLLANQSVAEFVSTKVKGKAALTYIYRIHDNPDPEKLEKLNKFVALFGHKFQNTDDAKLSTAINKLLAECKDKPEESAVEMMTLRAMAKAKYSTDNIGHYGLGFKYYSHFTSPIRRYPDMLAHRLLAIYLEDGQSQDKELYEAMCKHSSEREQLAVDAERASIKYKMVEFMRDKLGMEFEGRISGLTEWGMFVELEPTKIEGMISLHTIKSDYYFFDEERYALFGKSTGKRFMLGDTVKVKVARANVEQKQLDFELIEEGVE